MRVVAKIPKVHDLQAVYLHDNISKTSDLSKQEATPSRRAKGSAIIESMTPSRGLYHTPNKHVAERATPIAPLHMSDLIVVFIVRGANHDLTW